MNQINETQHTHANSFFIGKMSTSSNLILQNILENNGEDGNHLARSQNLSFRLGSTRQCPTYLRDHHQYQS